MTSSSGKRSSLAALLWAVVAAAASSAAADELYGTRLHLPAKMRPELQIAVDDLQAALRRITGADFAKATDGEVSGIVIANLSDPRVPADLAREVPQGGGEALVIQPDGERLWLIGRTDLGAAQAVYFYLDQLGCRWYFPSERWTIIPRRDDIRPKEKFAVNPAFRSRMFFGTGGFGGNLPLDPKREMQDRWTAWQRRNRFGGEFRFQGHTGEAFNLKYRKEIEAHPEWRAMVNGERQPWALGTKMCVGNQEVVDLYVKDRLADFRLRRTKDATDPAAWAVSAEPADGGGHCTAPESLAIGSVSDRVFHVANEVARAVQQEFPGGRVSVNAYGEHASVPTIPLEPNLYVIIVPYAFVRNGLSPEQMLDAWSKKVPQMGIYDYWAIPDWANDLPTFDPLRFGPDRLRGWRKRGIDSFLVESTHSSGAVGPAWYIASKLAWQPEADVDAIFGEFVRDCFGPAAEPMRRMLTRWSDHFTLTTHEVALSYRDVQAAAKLAADDPAAAGRVADYGRYVVYMRLRHEYQQAKRGSPEQRAAADKLARHVWSVYDSSMVHAFRLTMLIGRNERLAGNMEFDQTFDWKNAKAPMWATIERTSDDEIRRLIDAGIDELKPQEFVSRKFRGESVPVPNAEAIPATEVTFNLNNSLEFDFIADRADFPFAMKLAAAEPIHLTITGPDGKPVVAQEKIAVEGDWQKNWVPREFKLAAPGKYHVEIVCQKRPYRVALPNDIPLTFREWWNSQGTPSPRIYFYTPAETAQIALYANYIDAGPPRFFDPTGAEVKPTVLDNGRLLLIPVAAEHRGQIWSLDKAKCAGGPIEPLNIPAAFALSPRALLVPQDALK